MADVEPLNVEPVDPPPRKRSNLLLILVIIGGVVLGIPICCGGGLIVISFFTGRDEVVLSNPRGGLGSIQVDYRIPSGPNRRLRYFLVVETANGERHEWMAHGDLRESGTISAFLPGIRAGSTRPYKLSMEADGPGMRQQRISNVVELP